MPLNTENTTFTRDVLGRYICSTWNEATADPDGIDVVVIGGGMYGGYCASKIYQLSREAAGPDYAGDRSGALRVLVLEAGPFVLPEHTANIADLGFYGPGLDKKSAGSGIQSETRNEVWGIGWRSNQPFVGQAYCVGGKGISWGGWCPQLQPVDLAKWPADIQNYLTKARAEAPPTRPIDHRDQVSKQILKRGEPISGYEATEYEIGVLPDDQFVFDPVRLSGELPKKVGLNEALRVFLDRQKGAIDGRITKVLPAPIAVQTQSFISGLFSLDKYSSVPAMTAAARYDHGGGQLDLRFAIVPKCHVARLGLRPEGEAPRRGARVVETIQVNVDGRTEILRIKPHCQVILAMSCIESTRLALESFPLAGSGLRPDGDELMGRNYMIHLRFDINFDIERAQFADWVGGTWPGFELADELQLAALHVQCEGQSGVYQFQFYAATNKGGPDTNMYRMVPDFTITSQIAEGFHEDKVKIVLRASGEVTGGRAHPLRDKDFDYIDLASDFDYDWAFEHRRAWVQFNRGDHASNPIWAEMHDTAHAIARKLAGSKAPNYGNYFDSSGQKHNYTLPELSVQQGVGSTFHDAGTLWMGDDPDSSVTDVNGHFHHVTNAYCADQALFTTIGSANPVLTGLTLARKVAEHVVSRHLGHPNANPELRRSLLPADGWQSSPYAGMQILSADAGGLVETDPYDGIGLYWLPNLLENFDLSVQWKAFRTYRGNDVIANSGILLRAPDPRSVNFADRAAFEDFYNRTIEVQIDDSGKRFSAATGTAVFGDPRYRTGAIYGIAPATSWASALASPDGSPSADRYWNRYDISAHGDQITLSLNGIVVSQANVASLNKNKRGYVALQFHTGRVQFRNLSIVSR